MRPVRQRMRSGGSAADLGAVAGSESSHDGVVASGRRASRPSRLQRVPLIGNDLGLGHNARFIFLAMLFNEASFGFYQNLFPLYVEGLGASPGLVGLVIGLQGAVRLIFLAPAGMLADRIPLRRLIVGARTITIFGVLLYFLAQTWWHLIPAMLVMAAGNVCWPAVSKVVADSTTDRTRTRAFTLVYTVGPSFALIISPAIGGFMADWINLRSVFLAAAICQVIAVILFARIRPKEEAPHERREPVGYRQALGYGPVLVLCLLQFSLLFSLTIGFALAPNYLEDVKGLSIGTIGRFGSLIAVCSVLIGILVAKVKYFANPMNALFLAIALCPLAYLLLLNGGLTWHFALAYFLRGGYMVGWGLFYPAIGEVTPERLRTRAFALTELLGGFGFALAPFVAGALYSVDPALPIYVSLMLSIPMLAAIWLVRRYVAGHRIGTT